MKKLILISLLFFTVKCFSQTDTALGTHGKYIPLIPLSIPSNYLIAPNNHTIYFDSSKVGISLAKNATHDSIQLVSGSGAVLSTVKDSIGGGGISDSTYLPITTNTLGVTQNFSKGFQVRNYTAATSGNQQISGMFRWTGQGYNSSAAASQTVDIFADLLPIQNTGTPIGYVRYGFRSNGGTVNSNIMTVGVTSTTPVNGGVGINQAPGNTAGSALAVTGGVGITGTYVTTGNSALQGASGLILDQGGVSQYLRVASGNYYGVSTDKPLIVGANAAPAYGASMDMQGTGMAFLPPRLTTVQRDSINLTITSVTISNAGSGYTGSPTCTVTAGPTPTIVNTAQINLTLSGSTIGTATVVPSFIGHYNSTPTLTVVGTGSGAVLIPVMAQVLTEGMTIYNITTHHLQTWDGSTWQNAW